MLRHIGLFALALSIGWLGLAGHAQAVFPPPVKDEGKFFTAKGLEKANAKIKDIYQKYKKDVVVETLDALPVDQEKLFKEEGGKKFFPKYGLKRIKELGVNGVYVVISKKPRWAQLEMDPDTRKTVFSNDERDKAYKKLVDQFRNDEFDQGLLDMLDSIEASLQARAKTKAK